MKTPGKVTFQVVTLMSLFLFIFTGRSFAYGDVRGKSIEGVYELVSQEVRLTKPATETYKLSPPEWKGLWQIQNGYFSSVLSRIERKDFFDTSKLELGYESFAGTYQVRKNEIIFTQSFSINPLHEHRPVLMRYHLKNNLLTLTRTLHPTVEDMSKGSITIVLRRLPRRVVFYEAVLQQSLLSYNPHFS